MFEYHKNIKCHRNSEFLQFALVVHVVSVVLDQINSQRKKSETLCV